MNAEMLMVMAGLVGTRLDHVRGRYACHDDGENDAGT